MQYLCCTLTALVSVAGIHLTLTPSHIYVKNVEAKEQQTVEATVTAYSSTVDQTDSTPFTTASGERVDEDTIACPGRFDFGTEVIINGKTYECKDRMAKRYRDTMRFDVWKPSREAAYQWGKKKLFVTIR